MRSTRLHDFRFGGAITIDNSGATIRKNIIKNCYCISSAWMNSGAAIDCFELPESKTIIIEDNTILNNEARWRKSCVWRCN